VVLIRWTIPSGSGIRVTAAVLFPPEVKRRLSTIEAATRHALDLAGQAVARSLPFSLELDRLTCTVEVQEDDPLPFGEPILTTDEGTRVWLKGSQMG
jgi:hypothetical protein